MALKLGTLDLGGDGLTILTAAVSAKIGKTLNVNDFGFSDPEMVTIAGPTHNSRIRFLPKAASGFYGAKWVYYNRIHVTELGSIRVAKGSYTRLSQLLPQINDKYGILIVPADIYDQVLTDPPPGETEIEIILDFRPTSVIYYGGTRIIAGTNDPSIGDPNAVQLPFEAMHLFFTENIRNGKLEAASVAIDKDKNRQRQGSDIVSNDATTQDMLFQRQVDANELAAGKYGHIVGAWNSFQSITMRALTLYGQVIQLTTPSTGWTLVKNVDAIDMRDPAVVNDYQEKKPFKFVIQAQDGKLHALRIDTDVELCSSVDNGDNWTKQALSGTISSDPLTWEDAEILDQYHWVDTLYVLLKKADQVHLFEINPSNGTVNEVDLLPKVLDKTTGLTLEKIAKASFMSTTDTSVGKPPIAVLGKLANANAYQVFIYETSVTGYVPRTTSPAYTYPLQDSYQGSYLSAYSIQMTKDTTKWVDVIEVGTMVEAPLPDWDEFLDSPYRTQKEFFTHGLKVMTCVRQATSRGRWYHQELTLGNGGFPKRLLAVKDGMRFHFIFQAQNGMFSLGLQEQDPSHDFQPVLEIRGQIGKHTGFDVTQGFGVTLSEPITMEELTVGTYTVSGYDAEEPTSVAMTYSFMARDENDVQHWLVAAATGQPLTDKVIARESRMIPRLPSVVFYHDTNLYLVDAKTSNVWVRKSTGWEMFGTLSTVWNEGQAAIAVNFLNTKPEWFKGMVVIDGKPHLRMKVNETINVFQNQATELNKDTPLIDDVFVEIVTDTVADYQPNTFKVREKDLVSVGVNFAADLAPRRIATIGHDETGAKLRGWKTDVVAYDTVVNGFSTPVDYPLTGNLLDARLAVNYLNLKGWWLNEDAGVYNIVMQQLDNTYEIFGLAGSTNPGFTTFVPEVVFAMFDKLEARYVPLVVYGNKRVILMDRLDRDDKMTVTAYNLTVPTDNGTALIPIPVFTSGRCEYLFYQKGNGIFRINYTFDTTTRATSMPLVRMFDTTGLLKDYTFLHAAQSVGMAVSYPTQPDIQVPPPNGTLLRFRCDGTTKIGIYADGTWGEYEQQIATDSPDCGYVVPPPTSLSSTSVNLEMGTPTPATTMHLSELIKGEITGDNTAYALVGLDDVLTAEAKVTATVHWDTATASDVQEFRYKVGESGAWVTKTPAEFPFDITIPAGEKWINISATYVEDGTLEGDEEFTVELAQAAGYTNLTNTAPVAIKFQILDTSV